MEPINRYSLENFTERHRADFDLHEPRPELWSAIEQQLDAEQVTPTRLPNRNTGSATEPDLGPRELPTPLAKRYSWHYLKMACALLVLLGGAVLSIVWKANQPESGKEAQVLVAARHNVTDAALYMPATPAPENGPNGNARLDTAVHGMERYYATQLADRRAQLSQLAPDAQADWAQELIGLDSSYQQLRRELPQHPQPEVVLTAMNRNLQIRLDILDRQLELHGSGRPPEVMSATNSEFTLADSRLAANEGWHYER